MKKAPKSKTGVDELKGWQEIAAFLGQPVAIAQRWARSEGMPAERKGRYVYASRKKLNEWLGHESGEPVQISTQDRDLGADLRQALSFARKKKRGHSRAA